MKFEFSRTFKSEYSGFFETISLIKRFPMLFSVKNVKKTITTTALTFLLLSMTLPTLLINDVNASSNDVSEAQYRYYKDDPWWRIETDFITILFPASGKKPMFLWWYANDTDNIYVVKFKGLIEYLTLDYPYYQHRYEANNLTIQEQLEARCCPPELYSPLKRERIKSNIQQYIVWLLGLHYPRLFFNACRWNLTGPINVTREDGVSYISFNFTLVETLQPRFDFVEDNIIIQCRFYATEATENVRGLYNYTVRAGELKMDLIVRNWKWNIDKLKPLFEVLQKEYDITVPEMRTGLALWVDLASINIVDMNIAEQDANSPDDLIETESITSDMIVEGQRVQVRENRAAMGYDETPMNIRKRVKERCRMRFARESQPLAGFFDFVNKAVVINSTDHPTEVNVTAAYIPAGNHMRLFIGYPYFGNNTLEHDPSIGVESVTPWLPTNLLMLLIGATILIAVAVAAVKVRKKTVNIISVQ